MEILLFVLLAAISLGGLLIIGSVLRNLIRDQFDRVRKSSGEGDAILRQEIGQNMATSTDTLVNSIKAQLETMSEQQARLLRDMREGNEKKLEEMRQTVDEKLQGTLEKRLGEAFATVGKSLDSVSRGLGEMKQLAEDVGDFKKVLTNVKSRGTWGEVQLGALLEDILTPTQYGKNVKPIPSSNEEVEFAIRMPGRDDQDQVWLPVDSKFPQEDFIRLQEAQDQADPKAAEAAAKSLEKAIIKSGKDIRDKYISPPHTTDFGILFVPTESLYAEALRRPKLADELQKMRITLAGPSTITALLNSLRMGFNTLAIEERSSEVWEVLGAVRTEFSKFGGVLDKLKKQLGTAQNTIEKSQVRARAMERNLKSVEEVPEDRARKLLDLTDTDLEIEDVPQTEELEDSGD